MGERADVRPSNEADRVLRGSDLSLAGLQLAEGWALICDMNVILAIKAARSDAFARTRASLGTGSLFYHRGPATYGSFVAEAEALARSRDVSPDQVKSAFSCRGPIQSW